MDLTAEPITVTGFTAYWLANGLFRFRILMLFIISGYLFAISDHKPYKQLAGKWVKTLLYPYLIWSAAGLLLTFVLELFPYTSNVVAETHMMQLDETRTLLHQYHWYEILARCIFYPVVYTTKAIFMQFSDWHTIRMITFVVLPFCLIAGAVIFGALLRRLLPEVYSFVTGGRGLD